MPDAIFLDNLSCLRHLSQNSKIIFTFEAGRGIYAEVQVKSNIIISLTSVLEDFHFIHHKIVAAS